ncbi:transcription termination/antitermination NusG family protein [Yoonia sp. 67-2]|nr:transcription termination/antitermination NusG family protein [Yoonia sp. 67-2]
MENWFLAQCKPNSHAVAERNLTRQGFTTFLPIREETMRVRNRFVTKLRPLFPGYLFVALDVGAGKWRAVNSPMASPGWSAWEKRRRKCLVVWSPR